MILSFNPKEDTSTQAFFDLEEQSPQRQLAEKLDRPSFGNPDAKLVIVEFSDFQCPVCQAEFPIIREITNRYKDEILYIYRQYPVINEDSITLSHASLCAYEQNKFWQMHDKLFLSVNKDFSSDNLKNIARQSGLNIEQFDNCTQSEKYKNMLIEDFQDGSMLGISGTPTFFINGHKLAGNVSREAWEELLAKLLKQ